ncbi:helix-turn-helix domain-containing protein [Desulfotignum phosphitoxidans]|uniref:Helix-turn-helix domain-containing protein n=1 Tax=Desulfotignum phosphitoxidans DSM 13687 TaxID=1286635 RepID=S0FTZ5_9BACT|nr:helix-turn-helix transcriptional regulator [Desulfotignum phosphitoxidans]EMS78150.1 helix-turn-helix domain-containing protein [Desulfotignum phosphitoxidans DSM 13687]
MIDAIEKTALKNLGQRLKTARLARNDSQKEFAWRIGVSIPTLQNMEQGKPTVAIGTWIKALNMLDRLDDLNHLLAPEESLFAQHERIKQLSGRQRARRKK